MRLPEIQLDDRRFQDLVSEARTRIARSCPEWTEHNVSDPGITLEATGPLKLKGATVDIEASATVSVKGSLINIG